jgi:hypothetical protein
VGIGDVRLVAVGGRRCDGMTSRRGRTSAMNLEASWLVKRKSIGHETHRMARGWNGARRNVESYEGSTKIRVFCAELPHMRMKSMALPNLQPANQTVSG